MVDANESLRFSPATVCLKVGGTVTWHNVTNNLAHTTTDEPQLAANPADASIPKGGRGWDHPLPPGHSAKVKFTAPGVYKYFCIPHETLGMLGKVVVVR